MGIAGGNSFGDVGSNDGWDWFVFTSSHTLWKFMDLPVLPAVMGNLLVRLVSLAVVRQPVNQKEN